MGKIEEFDKLREEIKNCKICYNYFGFPQNLISSDALTQKLCKSVKPHQKEFTILENPLMIKAESVLENGMELMKRRFMMKEFFI